jgi:hypothetical protein
MAYATGRAAAAIFAVAVALAGCGGGDDADAVGSSVEASSASPETTLDTTTPTSDTTTPTSDTTTPTSNDSGAGSTATGSGSSGTLPDACTLLTSASVAEAIGESAQGVQPQPPNEASSRCDWAPGGAHSLALQVRAGSNAENTYNNTTATGFTPIDFAPADGWLMLGARESDRNYRLIAFAGYDGDHYVYFTLQGPDRDDGAATAIATALASEIYALL